MKKCHNIISKISDYFEDILTHQEKELVEQHLSSCPECKHEFSAYEAFFEDLVDSNTPDVPEDFLDKLHRRMNEESIALQADKNPGMLKFFYKSAPAPVRIALLAASVIFAIYVLFFTNLLPVSFSDKMMVQTGIEENKFFDDNAKHPTDTALQNTINQHKDLFYTENTNQNFAVKPDKKPSGPEQPVRKIVNNALTIKADEIAVYLNYESFRPELASIDPGTQIPDPGIDKNIEGLNGLGYFADMLRLINDLAEDSKGAVVDHKAGPPPHIIVRVPKENLSSFISKFDQYGDKQILLPPDIKHIDATQLDKDDDGFVQVHLKILIP